MSSQKGTSNGLIIDHNVAVNLSSSGKVVFGFQVFFTLKSYSSIFKPFIFIFGLLIIFIGVINFKIFSYVHI